MRQRTRTAIVSDCFCYDYVPIMPRSLLKRICPSLAAFRAIGSCVVLERGSADPRLWGLCRRAVTGAFGIGLAICFIPLPVHFVVASLLAVWLRLNIPVIYGTILLINPVTIVPVYYLAYRLGAFLLDVPPTGFAFQMSWDWLQNGLGPMWKPFLVGCLVCGVVGGVLGYMGLELAWRWRVATKYRTRHIPAPVVARPATSPEPRLRAASAAPIELSPRWSPFPSGGR